MGSSILHDDYRLPDVANSLPFKKGESYAVGIFENNPCFASIKKELGFGDSGVSNGDLDMYSDSKARSSPVERLILQEIQHDIVEYAASISVSTDPEQWSTMDTRKWLSWVANIYQLGDLSDCLSFDGATLCNFSEQEFILLTGSEDTGRKIAAQLDLWKNAIKMAPSAGFYHFQQQQAMDFKFGAPPQPDRSTPKLLTASCSWSTTNHTSAPPATCSSNQFSSASTGSSVSDFQNFNSSGYQYPPSSAAPACFAGEEVRYPPRPTIPLERFGSYRAACQSETFSPAQCYQRYTGFSQPNISSMMFQMHQKSAFQIPNKEGRDVPFMPNGKCFEESLREVPKEYLDSLVGHKTYTLDPKESLKALAILSKPPEVETQASERKVTQEVSDKCLPEPKAEKVVVKSEAVERTPSAAGENTAKQLKKKSSKHPIHLWEFLKQLLHDGKDCIRWLDQEKGVFKIYDSQQVAKYWGERKNRPAMNYDKLSRSIRQYYKKGIIKKTSQGKRLVYQFCEPYL